MFLIAGLIGNILVLGVIVFIIISIVKLIRGKD